MIVPTRAARAVALALCSIPPGLVASAAVAGESAELAEIRAQLREMKAAYEQRIAALESRLAQAERVAPAAPVAAAPGAAPAAATPPARGASAFNPEVSLILQGQYRNQKEIEERRIAGFWPAAAGGDGHAHGTTDRRGFSLDHTELVLAANIDPFWRGQAILAAADGSVEVEEAWFQSLGLGHGAGLKAGRLRSGIGYLNEQHPHQWDFADAPLAYRALFGGEASYRQDGLQLKWLAPTPFFLEFGAEAGRGAVFPGTDRNRNGAGSGAVFAHVGGDLGVDHSWRAGLSWLGTRASGREAHFEDINGLEAPVAFTGRSRTVLADFVWKWAPDGNPKFRNFKLQGEWFQRRESGTLDCADPESVGNACAGGVTSGYGTRQSGGYLQAVYQFMPRWRVGLRADRLAPGRRDLGEQAALLALDTHTPKRLSVMADYSWSEFSRVRVQLARDQAHPGVTDHQVTVQYIMSLGAHGAHKF